MYYHPMNDKKAFGFPAPLPDKTTYDCVIFSIKLHAFVILSSMYNTFIPSQFFSLSQRFLELQIQTLKWPNTSE